MSYKMDAEALEILNEEGGHFAARYYTEKPDVPGESNLSGALTGIETQIYAPTLKAAEKAAKARKLGEEVVGTESSVPPLLMASEWADVGNWPEAMHAACWLGFVAMKAGVCEIEELLGDRGIIHNLAHLCLSAAELAARPDAVEHLSRKIPGWLRALEARTPGFTRPAPVDVAKAVEAKDRALREAAEAAKEAGKLSGGLTPEAARLLKTLLGAAKAKEPAKA